MKLVSLQADGGLHRLWRSAVATPEPWGFLIPEYTEVEEGDGRIWSSPYPVVALFQPQRFFQVFLLLKPEGTTYYCNVISQPIYDARQGEIQFHDLALDVILDEHGPRLVDEEEFEMTKSAWSPVWVKSAETAAHELMVMAAERRGPFTLATANRWRVWQHSFTQ